MHASVWLHLLAQHGNIVIYRADELSDMLASPCIALTACNSCIKRVDPRPRLSLCDFSEPLARYKGMGVTDPSMGSASEELGSNSAPC